MRWLLVFLLVVNYALTSIFIAEPIDIHWIPMCLWFFYGVTATIIDAYYKLEDEE